MHESIYYFPNNVIIIDIIIIIILINCHDDIDSHVFVGMQKHVLMQLPSAVSWQLTSRRSESIALITAVQMNNSAVSVRFQTQWKQCTVYNVHSAVQCSQQCNVLQCSTKLPPLSKDTLTERHASPGFDPGLTGWMDSPPSGWEAPTHFKALRCRSKSGVQSLDYMALSTHPDNSVRLIQSRPCLWL